MDLNVRKVVELGKYEAKYLWQLNTAMTDIGSVEEVSSFKISEAYSTVDVVLEEDESVDDVYSEWSDHVNMTASSLKKWSENPCSREASVDPEAVIKRNLRLLEKNKEDWTEGDMKDAKRTISFISRMKANKPDAPKDGAHGCPSDWAISMLNWAYNPFDSVPSANEEVEDELEPVEEVSMNDSEVVREATKVFASESVNAEEDDDGDSITVEPTTIHELTSE